MRNSAGGSPVNLQIYIVIMRKKHRLLHLVVGCLFIIIMLLFRTYYRPWIYTNELLGLIVEGGLCDYKDIIATFVGALLSYVINRIIIQY